VAKFLFLIFKIKKEELAHTRTTKKEITTKPFQVFKL